MRCNLGICCGSALWIPISLEFTVLQVRDILRSFPGAAPMENTVGLDSSPVEDAGVDTLLRDGLRHVMDESKESLFEVERQFVSSVVEFLEVLSRSTTSIHSACLLQPC